MKYDFDRMWFTVDSVEGIRRILSGEQGTQTLGQPFLWEHTLEGRHFWELEYCSRVGLSNKARASLEAMVAQWEEGQAQNKGTDGQ